MKLSGGSSITQSSQIADDIITSADIKDSEIVDADIAANAAIANSKLATNPLARANHTGTQLASTISDFATAVDAEVNASGLLEASGADVNITNDTAETNIFSISIPGGTLSTNRAIKGYVHITNARFNDTSATLTLRLKYGATTLITMIIDPSAGTGGSHKGWLEFMLFANASASAQSAFLRARLKTETLDPVNTGAGDNMEASAVGTAAENSAGALNLVLSAKWATAALDNDFQRRGYVVEKLQ